MIAMISLDLYQTVACAILVYTLGARIRRKVPFFVKYCIPAPVIGGLLFALVTLVLSATNTVTIQTDNTMQEVFMMLFFTSVGYTASLPLLKKGGRTVIVFTVLCSILIVVQNLVGISLAYMFNMDPLIGLCVGSIPMVGGHGTAGSFGPIFESQFGVTGATSISVAAATFGLVAGGLLGGPVAKRRIQKKNLKAIQGEEPERKVEKTQETPKKKSNAGELFRVFCMLFLAAGLGTIISNLISKTGIVFPAHVGAMLAAAVLRNLSEVTKRFNVVNEVVSVVGNIALTLFLGMALMDLRLWELAQLAGPMLVMLLGQTVATGLLAYFMFFNVLGKDYEAAVMSSATCGFGMGAVPNAIANMGAITRLYGPAPKAFFIVPLVGSLFIDFINSGIITLFINILK